MDHHDVFFCLQQHDYVAVHIITQYLAVLFATIDFVHPIFASPVFLFYLRQDTCIHLTDRIAEPFDLQHVMCCDKNSLPSFL